MTVRKGKLPRRRPAAVLEAPTEQRELDLLALVQALERAVAVGRRVARDEQDRLHHSECS
jgi:hypothetical protein